MLSGHRNLNASVRVGNKEETMPSATGEQMVGW